MAKKEERFEVIFRDGSSLKDDGVRQILVDKETGVNYLCWKSGYGAGITPLLDSEGKVIVTKSNSSLSNQSSETLVFSRKIGILILVPYVFSLVFALMSRNKGNFLFRLPRPPYQAVLRKFVSLPS